MNEIYEMNGDGVNDENEMKKDEIGIEMGYGKDVEKYEYEMVIDDDNL